MEEDTSYDFLKKFELELELKQFNGLKLGYYCYYEGELYEILRIHQLKGVTIRKRGEFCNTKTIGDPFHLVPAPIPGVLFGPVELHYPFIP
jgi:hypothetical protein